MSACTNPVACRYCARAIVNIDGRWIDPEATGDDRIWRETCDSHDTFTAEHEPTNPDDQACVSCGASVGPLEVFPAPAGTKGIRCLDCYAASAEGRRMPTGDELTRMWGGGR